MVIEGSVSVRLGRVRSGKETVECILGPGEWFGWEALKGFTKRNENGDKNYRKPGRTTLVKALKNTQVWVVPGAKFRKLFEKDNEARFDLQDKW
jgi:CRP-like cAMP-binding protein